MVGHQKAAAKRPDHLHFFTHLEVTHEVGGHAAHRLAVMVFEHTLDGERQVVVSRTLAIALGKRLAATAKKLQS